MFLFLFKIGNYLCVLCSLNKCACSTNYFFYGGGHWIVQCLVEQVDSGDKKVRGEGGGKRQMQNTLME